MEQQKRRYTLDEIKAMDSATVCRRSCMEVSPEDMKKYLYDRPDFKKSYKKIWNANILTPDDGHALQDALNEYLDKLYEQAGLPSQMVASVLFDGENVHLGYHWLASKDEPDRSLQDMMRDNGWHVSDDNKAAFATAEFAKGKEALKAARPAWMDKECVFI